MREKYNPSELNNIKRVVKNNNVVIFHRDAQKAWSKVVLNLIEQVRSLTKEKDWRLR